VLGAPDGGLPAAVTLIRSWREKVGKVRKVRTHLCSCAEKSKNKAGMFMITNGFHFWNGPKAGMCMKTSRLSAKAGMLLMIKEMLWTGKSGIRLYHLKY
jgi:hypothetical protein